jgi:hypothetical protein
MTPRVKEMTDIANEHLRKAMRAELEVINQRYEYTDPKREEETSKVLRKWYSGEEE